MELFEVEIIYQVSTSLIDNEEMSDVEKLTNELTDDLMFGTGYWDLTQDPIARISPKCLIPKGRLNRKHFSEVTFASGNIEYCNLKPNELRDKLDAFM